MYIQENKTKIENTKGCFKLSSPSILNVATLTLEIQETHWEFNIEHPKVTLKWQPWTSHSTSNKQHWNVSLERVIFKSPGTDIMTYLFSAKTRNAYANFLKQVFLQAMSSFQ